jgi:hypothetical protein
MKILLERMNTCAGGLQSVTVDSKGSATSPQGICGYISLILLCFYLFFKLWTNGLLKIIEERL